MTGALIVSPEAETLAFDGPEEIFEDCLEQEAEDFIGLGYGDEKQVIAALSTALDVPGAG